MRPRFTISDEIVRAAGERYINGAKMGDLAREFGISASVLYDRIRDAGYRLSQEETRRRQASSHPSTSGYRGDLAARSKARDAEAIWDALSIKFEDAPRVKDQPGRLPSICTHVPQSSSIDFA